MAKKRRNVTYEKFDKVIQLIENEGLSLRKALSIVKFSSDTFDCIIDEDENKMKRYARAREKRADLLFENILEIARQPSEGITTTIKDDGRVETTKFDNVQRSKAEIDAIKWMLGKMQPKKYGDKLDVTTDGEKLPATSNAITIEIVKPTELDE